MAPIEPVVPVEPIEEPVEPDWPDWPICSLREASLPEELERLSPDALPAGDRVVPGDCAELPVDGDVPVAPSDWLDEPDTAAPLEEPAEPCAKAGAGWASPNATAATKVPAREAYRSPLCAFVILFSFLNCKATAMPDRACEEKTFARDSGS